MSESLHIDTRSRSRSKTPFLRSQCDQESCAHAGEEGHQHNHAKKKKDPIVATIVEEKTETLVSTQPNSNSKKETTSTKSQQIITKTSDYSSDEPSPNSSIVKSSSPLTVTDKNVKTVHSTSSVSITVKSVKQNSSQSKINETSSENVRTQYTHDLSKNGSNINFIASPIPSTSGKSKEISQNEINTVFEKSHLQTSTPIVLRSSAKTHRLSFNNSQYGDMSNHIAYREYREAGEYWKKYPKTDYTYSKLSPHRREIAPGIVGMPNMSRKSLENHGERINYMIERDPLQEEFIRKRYEAAMQYKNVGKTVRDNYLTYDSQDEVDFEQLQGYKIKHMRYSQTEQSWLTRTVTKVITTFYNFASAVVGDNENHLYRTKMYSQQKGFFGRIGSALMSTFLTIFRTIYFGIASVLCFDTRLLQSSSVQSQNKKRFLIFLLILLPFLLLGAWYLLEDSDRQTYLIRTKNLLPISLISFRNWFTFDWINYPINFNNDLINNNKLKSSQYESITSNIQKSLSNEEYENILNHINSYVQQLVNTKLEEHNANAVHGSTKITSEMSELIAKVVQQQIEAKIPIIDKTVAKPYVMSEKEIQEITERIKENLLLMPAGSGNKQFSMTQENLEQITKLIKQNIEINNNHFKIIENIDIDELLFRILQSPKLHDYVDARIDQKLQFLQVDWANDRQIINNQKLVIDELNNEIKFIKSQLSGHLNENVDLQLSLTKLANDQNRLSERYNIQETNVNERFSNLLHEIDSKLSALNQNQFKEINRQIKISLMEILNYKNENQNIDEIDLHNWMRNMFVAKEFLEDRLKGLYQENQKFVNDEIDRSGAILIQEISEKLKVEILNLVENKQKEQNILVNAELKQTLDESEIKNIVKEVLAVYDADKTGMVDYALESAGGQILSTRCTENYQTKSAQISIFGIPLWYPSNTPRIAIAPNVQPGECWAFQGFPGYLVLKLNTLVYVTGFTLEHIPKILAPNGRIDSAPRKFSVYGLQRENESDGVQFGEYEFLNNDKSMQYFAVQNQSISRPYEVVELKIESNHGHQQYTCLYRFRVHGKPTTTKS